MTPNRRFSLALDSLSELNLQATPAPSQPTQSASELSDVLAKLGPLPREGPGRRCQPSRRHAVKCRTRPLPCG